MIYICGCSQSSGALWDSIIVQIQVILRQDNNVVEIKGRLFQQQCRVCESFGKSLCIWLCCASESVMSHDSYGPFLRESPSQPARPMVNTDDAAVLGKQSPTTIVPVARQACLSAPNS